MTDQALELSIIKSLLGANNPIPTIPFDIALDESGGWTVIVYRDDLLNYPADRTVPFMRWLHSIVFKAWNDYHIFVRVERL